jgi:molecular chaperone GrpE
MMEGDYVTEKDNLNSKDMENGVDQENDEMSVQDDLNQTQGEGSNNDLNTKLEEKEKECQEYLDLLKRTKAEFDNFRKRAIKEKEASYDEGFTNAMKNMLPVLDNLERAVGFSEDKSGSLAEGVEMVLKMFKDTLSKAGIEEIEADGQKFDPDYHNAVMHIEDENFEDNAIVEVLQKGYKYKDKVLRYSMVKVAN